MQMHSIADWRWDQIEKQPSKREKKSFTVNLNVNYVCAVLKIADYFHDILVLKYDSCAFDCVLY